VIPTQLQTTRFGAIAIDPSLIFTFPTGLPGFPAEQRFTLLRIGLEDTPFIWMQSVTNPDLCFLLVDPTAAFTNYSVDLSPTDAAQLEWTKEQEAALQVLCIVSVPDGDLQKAIVNLKAPLWFNPASKLALQAILDNDAYSIRYPLFAQGGE